MQLVTPITDSDAEETLLEAYRTLNTEVLDHIRGAHSILYSEHTEQPITDAEHVAAIRLHAKLARRTTTTLEEDLKAFEQRVEAREDQPAFYEPLDKVIGGVATCDKHLTSIVAISDDIQAGATDRAPELEKPGIVRAFDRATTAFNALESILVDEFDYNRDDLR